MVRSIRARHLPIALGGILALLALAVVASTPAQAAGSGPAELFDPMMQALGGREAIADLRSLAVEAACSGPDGAFNTQVHSVRGTGTYFRQAVADQTIEIWSTPDRTWSLAEDGSLREQPAAVRAFLRGHEFHLQILEVEERFSLHRLTGSESFDDRPSRRIDMVDEAGAAAVLWIDQENDLPLALETNPEGAAGAVRVVFGDWAAYEGVQLFRSFDLTEGADRRFHYDYVTLRANPPSENLFAPPVDSPVELSSARQALEAILQTDREAHLRTDAGMLTAHIADSLVEVSAGGIATRSRREVIDFFTSYFEGATYHSWEDSEPPVVRLSSDHGMAWVVRRVTADREELRDGQPVRQQYTSAYTATYERRDGRWWMTSVTSTFLPRAAES